MLKESSKQSKQAKGKFVLTAAVVAAMAATGVGANAVHAATSAPSAAGTQLLVS